MKNCLQIVCIAESNDDTVIYFHISLIGQTILIGGEFVMDTITKIYNMSCVCNQCVYTHVHDIYEANLRTCEGSVKQILELSQVWKLRSPSSLNHNLYMTIIKFCSEAFHNYEITP